MMQFIIPDIPAEVKTQMQREQLLAKEAKYQHGVRENAQDQDLTSLLKNHESDDQPEDGGAHTVAGSIPFRGGWARKFSRANDSLDAHVNVTSRKRGSDEVWDAS